MALKTNQPVVKDEITYDKYGVNLALSSMWRTDGVGVSVAVRLTPYRVDENGTPDHLDSEARAVVYGDATQGAATDPDLAQFLSAIEAAGQAFIDAKGL